MIVTVYSQDACQPCRMVKKTLTAAGIPFTERDVQADPAALDEVIEFYAYIAPGRRPETPVTVIDDYDGHGSREIILGLHPDRLRDVIRTHQATAA